MGNQQGGAGAVCQTSVPSRQQSLTHNAIRYPFFDLDETESHSVSGNATNTVHTDLGISTPEANENIAANKECLQEAAELENSILLEDINHLKSILNKININIHLNAKGETALMLAVKLSSIEIVKLLLLKPYCDKNCLNIHSFSPLDVAFVMAFDNRLEPRQSVCWGIIECLLQVNAEPNNKDAMMYIIRTAFKHCDEDFINHLLVLAIKTSNSDHLHELILQMLHRHQPVYNSSLDPFFIKSAEFTIKLLKNANVAMLGNIVISMIYYLDSYWHDRDSKAAICQKLVVYASAAGWEWTPQYIEHISRGCPGKLASWCRNLSRYPLNLQHVARKSFRKHLQCLVPAGFQALPSNVNVPVKLKSYILLDNLDKQFMDGLFDITNFFTL